MLEEKNEACQGEPCGLPKSTTACPWSRLAPEFCRRCGWNTDEQARRKALPLVRGADGLYHKDIRPEE